MDIVATQIKFSFIYFLVIPKFLACNCLCINLFHVDHTSNISGITFWHQQ